MPELLQEAFTAEAVAEAVRPWLTDHAAHAAAVAALDAVVRRLETGAASMDLIVKRITS